MQKTHWYFNDALVPEKDKPYLDGIDKIKNLSTTLISRGQYNQMTVCHLSNSYYVKTYTSRGSWLRSMLGKSRLENEFNNFAYFQQHNIPTPSVIAFGYKKKWGRITEGVIVTQGLANTSNLADLYKQNQLPPHGKQWLANVLKQIADYTARMHADNFMFSDLKWRNILVSDDDTGTVYFIDCPNGMHVPKWFMWRAIIKDLACLDKIGNTALTRTQRLAFYKQYRGITKLTSNDKKRIANILKFFEGRE
jgi:tRNA A-37 threonylcarbamoyl transferase component Bud32